MAVRRGASMVGLGEGVADMGRDAENARWQAELFEWFEAHADPATDVMTVDRLGWLALVRSLRSEASGAPRMDYWTERMQRPRPGIDAPFASAAPGPPVDGRWLDSSWSRADTAASAVLLAAVASRRWLFAAGFAAGSALTAWRAAEMFRR